MERDYDGLWRDLMDLLEKNGQDKDEILKILKVVDDFEKAK